MSGHLCLKWNNHSSAFLKSISNIQIKERYCDATIACQGKYFPVHRIILSTCSDYFEEMFERMQCAHPYIVFKDIEPREMELLLNYMYQGEVNVVQEKLPMLIKAAEALRVKGLAVPDEMPSSKECSTGKKRSTTSNDNPQPKRRLEESNRRMSSESNTEENQAKEGNTSDCTNIEKKSSEYIPTLYSFVDINSESNSVIKQEPSDTRDYNSESVPMVAIPPQTNDNQFLDQQENTFTNYPVVEESYSIKTEDEPAVEQPFESQQSPSSWSGFNAMSTPMDTEMNKRTNIIEESKGSDVATSFNVGLHVTSSNSLHSLFFRKKMAERKQNMRSQIHECRYCNYKSWNRSNVTRHIQFKHIADKPYKCNICPFKFTSKTNLERHVLTHTGEKPFHCPNCYTEFRHKTSLKNHLARKTPCFKRM